MARARLVRTLLIGAGIPVLICAILFPVFARARERARRSSCQSSLKQIGMGLAQYRQDYDEMLPPLALAAAPKKPRKDCMDGPAFGWSDGIQPYVKSVCILQCPSEGNSPSASYYPEKPGYSDYWMNTHVAGRKLASPTLIMLGDGNGLHSSRYGMGGLPTNWQDAPPEMARVGTQLPWYFRHLSGANYAFADGHVKWLRPAEIGSASARFTP